MLQSDSFHQLFVELSQVRAGLDLELQHLGLFLFCRSVTSQILLTPLVALFYHRDASAWILRWMIALVQKSPVFNTYREGGRQ